MANPMLDRAANLIEQARALDGEFEDKSKMPADVAHKIDELLRAASACRAQVEREQTMTDLDGFIHEPQRKGYDPYANADAPSTGGLTKTEKKERETNAFWIFAKKGYAGMSNETKAALIEDTTGQLLVPHDYAGTILQDLPRLGVMRDLVFVRPTSSNKVDVGSVVISSAGWGKLDSGSFADGLAATPAVTAAGITVFDLMALVKLGRDELEDSPDNLAEIIRQALTMKFAEMEDDAIAIGTAAGSQPIGFAGTGTTVTQNVTAATTGTVVSDDLVKLPYVVPMWAQRQGVFVGSGPAEQAIALLKDGTNNYIWQPSVQLGTPAKLLGYDWYRHDGLPTPGAGAAKQKAVFFGAFKQAYMLADRRQLVVQRLEERFADEGKVGLLFSERVGGDVIRPKGLAYYNV